MGKLEKVARLALKKTGGDRDAANAFIMEQLEHDDAFREEMKTRALERIVGEMTEEVLQDPRFSSLGETAISNEVIKRIRRAHLKVVPT